MAFSPRSISAVPGLSSRLVAEGCKCISNSAHETAGPKSKTTHATRSNASYSSIVTISVSKSHSATPPKHTSTTSSDSHVLNPNNPALTSDGPIYTTYDGSLCPEDAISDCIDSANGDGAEGYQTVDIHYVISNDSWVCVAYEGYITAANEFNVTDNNVGLVFGYSGG
ncbi:hypothetical protein ANO11243_080480 [Dothideomycetidae sp. 11243]|nr:hypothetical protein ANO11243_080480 [fungal sp. No.11243]